MQIREATPTDWLAVAALLAELGRPDLRGTEAEAEGRRMYERYLERPDAVALVAEIDGTVVGFLDMEFRTWLNFTALQAWTPDLVVAERSRGQRVGGALLARAEQIARDRGCWSMAARVRHLARARPLLLLVARMGRDRPSLHEAAHRRAVAAGATALGRNRAVRLLQHPNGSSEAIASM